MKNKNQQKIVQHFSTDVVFITFIQAMNVEKNVFCHRRQWYVNSIWIHVTTEADIVCLHLIEALC